MADEQITATKIAENAAKPQSASGDGESVSQFSISDQIQALQFQQGQTALEPANCPIRIRKIQRPGTA